LDLPERGRVSNGLSLRPAHGNLWIPRLVGVDDGGPAALSTIGFGPTCVTFVIADAWERGQNSLVTIARLPQAEVARLGRFGMSVVLLILGIVVAAAGIATIGFGIPNNDFTLSTTLFITGTTALTGGLILIGLSAVVTELGRVAEGLKNRTVTPRSNSATKQGAESLEPALEPVIASVAPPAALNQAPIPPPAPPAQ